MCKPQAIDTALASPQKPPNSQEKGGWTQYAYTEAATYQYNDAGIRTVKVVNGIRHEYDVVGGQINREVIRSILSPASKKKPPNS